MKGCSIPIGVWALLLPAVASGQDGSLNVFLLEKSYAALGTPSVIGAPSYYSAEAEPGLIAEAQIAVHLPLFRQVTFQHFQDGIGDGLNVFLTPQLRLRALDIPSAPIRSMSFMPKFTIQHLWVLGGDGTGDPGTRHVWGAMAVLGHHSNGGPSCEFTDQVQGEDGECRIPGSSHTSRPDPQDREVRVNGGNFSTNFVELGVGYRYGVTSSIRGDHWKHFLEVSTSWQHHHDWIGFPLPGGPDPAFGALYGLDRLRLDVSGQILLSPAIALRSSARWDYWHPDAERYPGARTHTLESELFLQFVDDLGCSRWYCPGIVGIGLRFVHGMDPYNTQYVRDIRNLQLAIIVDPWSPRISP
jgi:hypothetical protein